MQASIEQLDLQQEYYTDEKCYITEVSNSPATPDLSIARARVEPGVTTCWHRLKDTTERYVILSGTGPDDLIFLAICSPRFQTETYQDIEAVLE